MAGGEKNRFRRRAASGRCRDGLNPKIDGVWDVGRQPACKTCLTFGAGQIDHRFSNGGERFLKGANECRFIKSGTLEAIMQVGAISRRPYYSAAIFSFGFSLVQFAT